MLNTAWANVHLYVYFIPAIPIQFEISIETLNITRISQLYDYLSKRKSNWYLKMYLIEFCHCLSRAVSQDTDLMHAHQYPACRCWEEARSRVLGQTPPSAAQQHCALLQEPQWAERWLLQRINKTTDCRFTASKGLMCWTYVISYFKMLNSGF